MSEDRDPADDLVNPDLVGEYLRSLQDGLDTAVEKLEAQRARIEKLEGDREVLRERLEAARRRADLRARVRDALLPGRGDEPTSEEAPSGAEAAAEAPNGGATAELPVVGRLGPVDWPAPAPDRDLRIGLVADDFTTQALRYEAHCVALHREDAAATVRRDPPDLLFVESAYGGPGGSWRRRIARFGGPHPDLVALVEAARDRDVPTVFWNKEDPVNSDWFTASAALFDHVFTVDAGMVDTYRERFGHDDVHALPFAAQPAIHRPPVSPGERTGPVLFAGTWFAAKHPERREQMAMLLDPARAHGLHILDRHAGDDPRFAWPERFQQHVVGSLPYPLAVEATRRYRVVVNVNTVTDSPTMCARRVFELAATATPVVSGPSRAVEALVPDDAIALVHDADAAAAAYDRLLGDPAVAAEQGEAARQWVLDGHTWRHRIDTVLAAVTDRG